MCVGLHDAVRAIFGVEGFVFLAYRLAVELKKEKSVLDNAMTSFARVFVRNIFVMWECSVASLERIE